MNVMDRYQYFLPWLFTYLHFGTPVDLLSVSKLNLIKLKKDNDDKLLLRGG